MIIELTNEEVEAIENAWKIVRNKICGDSGTLEEIKKVNDKLHITLAGLRTLMNKTKNNKINEK
jgi:hypothetical protein